MTSRSTRIIVITGVTRGLGRALTEFFISNGHTVAGCGRSTTAIRELQKQYPAPHRFDVVDVASDDEVARWAKATIAAPGVPDLLINNAAILARPGKLWEVPARDFDESVDVNVKGVANVVRHFVPWMVRRKRGVIINISSGWGRSVSAGVAPYCATKWAIEGLTQALAQELPQGMAAIALNPGIIDTDMLRACFGNEAAKYPKPRDWAKKAGPFILRLGPEHNGQSLTAR